MSGLKIRKILIVFTVIVLLVAAFFVAQINRASSPDTSSESALERYAAVYDRYDQVIFPNINDIAEPAFAHVMALFQSESDNHLTIDGELQRHVYDSLKEIAEEAGYQGGAGVVMDIETGELLTLTSFPAYENAPSKQVSSFVENEESLLINHALTGYMPGSAIKPFIALAALGEEVIEPGKEIISTGSLELPSPYGDGKVFVFKDWKAHGPVDMEKAIGVSSNVYFYTIGGGYGEQSGVGIWSMVDYLKAFGFATRTGAVFDEIDGAVPTPEWKQEKYGDEWRLGDTYLTAIGQHGYEVTPLQLTRAIASVAANGSLVVPTIQTKGETVSSTVPVSLSNEQFSVVKRGMVYTVTNGTAASLYHSWPGLAAKTGTAEVDVEKKYINSWITGYFPASQPKYAFTFMLANGPWGEETGAVAVADLVGPWLSKARPYYLEKE